MKQWEKMLAAYAPEQVERLEAAAEKQSDRIAAAAIDPTNNRVQSGIDIGELWFAVVRLREDDLASKVAIQQESKREVVEALRENGDPVPADLAADVTTSDVEPFEIDVSALWAQQDEEPAEAPAEPAEPVVKPEPTPAPRPARKAPTKAPAKRGPGRPRKTPPAK